MVKEAPVEPWGGPPTGLDALFHELPALLWPRVHSLQGRLLVGVDLRLLRLLAARSDLADDKGFVKLLKLLKAAFMPL